MVGEIIAQCDGLFKDGHVADSKAILKVAITDLLNQLSYYDWASGDAQSAINDLHIATDIDSSKWRTYSNLSYLYNSIGKFHEGVASAEMALERCNYSISDVWHNFAVGLESLQMLDQAIDAYRKYLELKPDAASIEYHLGLCLLKNGELSEGFKKHELRFEANKGLSGEAINIWEFRQYYTKPNWTGEDIPGKTLLVYSEQGYGDVIHFMRYLPLIKNKVGRIIVEVRDSVSSLIKDVDASLGWESHKDENGLMIINHSELPDHDYVVSLGSLPHILGVDTVEPFDPYVKAEKPVLYDGDAFKVGICWAGSHDHGNDVNRSTYLKHFKFLNKYNTDVFMLQKGEMNRIHGGKTVNLIEESDGLGFHDLSNQMINFSETANLIHGLDLIITVDTSIAHLSGAMGKEVWVLLPYDSEWRWMKEDKSSWYQNMRLFRQNRKDDWDSVFSKVDSEFCKLQYLVG